MVARIPTNAAKLRSSARSMKIPRCDAAALQLAARLAELLDAARPTEPAWLDDDPPDEAEVYRLLGPLYLRTLTALGLSRAGRGAGDNPGAVTVTPARRARDELRDRRDRRAQ
jgi:hypothetical protein